MNTDFFLHSTSVPPKPAFSQQELYQSQSAEIRAVYDKALPVDRESVTTVRGNDVSSRFRVAFAQLPMTTIQRAAVRQLKIYLEKVEKDIDPTRLTFSISSSPDDDVVLNHRHKNGVFTLIIHDDGSVALSYIYAKSHPDFKDELTFFEAEEADFEKLAYLFLVGQGA